MALRPLFCLFLTGCLRPVSLLPFCEVMYHSRQVALRKHWHCLMNPSINFFCLICFSFRLSLPQMSLFTREGRSSFDDEDDDIDSPTKKEDLSPD